MIDVHRFPGQEHQAGNPKIPTVIWYDRHGDAVKAGAEAEFEEQSNVNTAEEQGWTKVELYVPQRVPVSDSPLTAMRHTHQVQAPPPSEIDEAGHERHEIIPSAEIKVGDRGLWRLP